LKDHSHRPKLTVWFLDLDEAILIPIIVFGNINLLRPKKSDAKTHLKGKLLEFLLWILCCSHCNHWGQRTSRNWEPQFSAVRLGRLKRERHPKSNSVAKCLVDASGPGCILSKCPRSGAHVANSLQRWYSPSRGKKCPATASARSMICDMCTGKRWTLRNTWERMVTPYALHLWDFCYNTFVSTMLIYAHLHVIVLL
jgi:hypothetical protein